MRSTSVRLTSISKYNVVVLFCFCVVVVVGFLIVVVFLPFFLWGGGNFILLTASTVQRAVTSCITLFSVRKAAVSCSNETLYDGICKALQIS